MSLSISEKVQNSANKAEYSSYKKIVEQIRLIEFVSLDNQGIFNKTNEFRNRLLKGAVIEDIIIEALALAREVTQRVLKICPYDEQLIAGIAMHRGRLIEMQTGEGKTLAAVFPAFLNALTGLGCHILTFNDYLARRDAEWMGPVFEMLGLTVGFVQASMKKDEKRRAYDCDITYVTAKVAGFDYLTDSLCYKESELMLRPFNFAIVDEADSIIIDEARIPLVIATRGEESENTLSLTMEALRKLEPEVDYKKDEAKGNVYLTETGLMRVETMLCCENLYADENFKLLCEVQNILHAMALLTKDIDYIVRDNKIEMVDEFTGRVAKNRRWPDGIQAALEAKESLLINSRGRIMNQITLQSFILLYKKLAGMTGTAKDSANEISEFYDMDVFVIPPHVPCNRLDFPDVIFTHKEAKYKALVAEIMRVHNTGQPILIGTCSVEESEYLAEQLTIVGVKHEVLNAKNDELEARIIEEAGSLYSVTVSTNMAGRGVDIKLGGVGGVGKDEVASLGGLYIVGTNRHESARVDKQLKGRSGRQGDVGISRFFISLEDDLLKKYDIDKLTSGILRSKKYEEPLNDPKIAKKVGQTQRIVQGQYSDLRRALWQYAFFIENQRIEVYRRRMEIVSGSVPFNILGKENPKLYAKLINYFGKDIVADIEKEIALYSIDEVWADYLNHVEYLKDGVRLSVIKGKNPIREFQIETDHVFQNLEKEVQKRILEDFQALEISNQGLVNLKERIKPPSETWTYLVNDNSLMGPLSALFIANTISYLGRLLAWPILFVISVYKKIFKKIYK